MNCFTYKNAQYALINFGAIVQLNYAISEVR